MRPFAPAFALACLLGATFLPLAVAFGQNGTCQLPNNDTTPPFTDRCYHQGVWFSPDTADLDVIMFPPASPYELREWQLIVQSVANWESGIRALGAPWMSGLRINDYAVGREPIPASAWADPEVIVALHTNVLPLGSYAGAATQWPGICHGLEVPADPTTLPTWHAHAGSPYGNYQAACSGGGRVCVVTDAATLGTPTDADRRVNFDLISHEVGHCLSLGHVGDADTESTDDSLAYPEHDIMSYENDGQHASTMHCPSNLNIRTLEKAYGALLGQAGATTAVAPAAASYVHMQPSDWDAYACVQSTAAPTDTDYLTGVDPLGLDAEPDADGDGVGDSEDACPGSDDRLDADADGTPDDCDADDGDGPGGDLDGDGVVNAQDQCPGVDDGSPACIALAGTTFYFGRGPLATSSGNLDVAWGDTTFFQNVLAMDPGAPEFTDPAVILAPGVDDTTAAHNPFYEPAEWATSVPVDLTDADVDVVWWGIQPATGGAFYEQWDVKLYFDGAATPAASALNQEFTGTLDGATPTEYRATLRGVTGSGTLSVVIDPSSFTNQQDFLIVYDGIDHPSRVTITQASDDGDSDDDGVLDDADACPGFDDFADRDGDGTADGCDDDRDGDGVANRDDALPDDPTESVDSDGDGTGDNSDVCAAGDDGADLDADGTPDACDDDRDGDGVANASDAFPDDAGEWSDSDADGVGDNADACPGFDDAADGDGDGTPDGCEPPSGLVITSPVDGADIDGVAPLLVTGSFAPEQDDEECTDCNGDGFVVMAVVDTGINPYNPDFKAVAGQPTGHPSTYIDGFPADAPALTLSCTATTAIPTACANDFAGVAQNKLYTIPGTKIIGALSTDKAGADFAPTPILDNNGHGTGSASVAVGNAMGTCPQCLLVVVEGFNVGWAYQQPWIDLVSNSWGRRANAGLAVAEGDDFVFGSAAELDRTRAFTEDGGTSLWAAGNGAENAFVVPISTYTAPYTGADWHYVVGAVITGNDGPDAQQAGEQSIVGSGKPVTVSSYGSGTIAASCYNNLLLTCGHSGTSAATPITAGVMASVLAKAKQMLGSSSEGPEGDGIAASGTPVAGNPYLSDGALSRQELWALVSKTARDQDSGWISVPVTTGHTGTPVDHAMTGYGIVNRWSRDDAVARLATGAALPDRSDVDEFMAQDSAIRQALWGGWDGTKFAASAPIVPARGVTQANALATLEAATAHLDGALRAASEADDDGTVPGAWGEVGDVTLSNTDERLVVRLELSGALDGAVPTVLGNPFTYQVTLTAPHNVAGQQYRATYTFDAATTAGGVLTDTFTFNVLTQVDAQGLQSICPVATDLSQSRYDIDTGDVVWSIPLSAFDHDTRPTRAAGCAAFTRAGDDLAGGDVLTGILGESTVKLATVSIGGLGDESAAADYTLQSSEPPACEDGDHIEVTLSTQSACIPFDPLAESEWQATLSTGLAPGSYDLVATAHAGGTAIGTHTITVVVPEPDADADGVLDGVDNCPADANAGQEDLDGDLAGDACDADRDGDGVANDADSFPDDATESADTDGDGVGDNADACAGHDDGADLDRDGTADGCDADRDGDGYSNGQEASQGSDPDDAASKPDNKWTMAECAKWRSGMPAAAPGPQACRDA